MEYKASFEVFVNYLEKFCKSDAHRRYSYHRGGDKSFCIGQIEDSCVYESTGGGQIIRCENIKVDFNLFLILFFRNVDVKIFEYPNEKSISNIKGNLEIETPSGYYFKNLDYSQISTTCSFLMREHLTREITKLLLQESRKVKTSFQAKIHLNFKGEYM